MYSEEMSSHTMNEYMASMKRYTIVIIFSVAVVCLFPNRKKH